jgi:hypothetical protein
VRGVDGERIAYLTPQHETRLLAATKRAALYVRVSTSDRGQTIENQLQPLQEAARRLGWTVVAIYRDEGISGTKGRDRRPGLNDLLKGVAHREFGIVAAWSVCRLGRSFPDLIGLLGELQARDIDLYLHQQALDTSTPSGRMLFGMLSVFSEFERAMRGVFFPTFGTDHCDEAFQRRVVGWARAYAKVYLMIRIQKMGERQCWRGAGPRRSLRNFCLFDLDHFIS